MISACLHFRCAPVLLRHGYAPKRCGKAGCDQSHGSNHTVAAAEALAPVLDRKWLLKAYESQLRRISIPEGEFLVVQDDLLHPVLGGNKLRKLDGLLPEIQAAGCTDLLTCGGLQSAHTAAVAAACAEQGIKAHLLIRGERPAVPTGFHLLARMYAQVTYISRSEYADRETMMQTHAERITNSAVHGSKLHVLPEGASEPAALLGCIRLIHWLAQPQVLGLDPVTLVVDCGTGTTATGLALGIQLAGLPWQVHGVMLAGPATYYTDQQNTLMSSFMATYLQGWEPVRGDLPLVWSERLKPRRFGKVFRDDVRACQQVAQQHGILLDPIYSLAAWEAATQLVQTQQKACAKGHRTIMLHTGGALGLQGVAQQHPDWF